MNKSTKVLLKQFLDFRCDIIELKNSANIERVRCSISHPLYSIACNYIILYSLSLQIFIYQTYKKFASSLKFLFFLC